MFLLPVSRELPVEEEIIQTQLHSRTSDEYYTYSNVPWKLYMRKEVCFYLSFFFSYVQKNGAVNPNVNIIIYIEIQFIYVCPPFTGFLS